jgi:hypothetical protein
MRLMKRIHVVGVGPRTGTSLMAQCMAAGFHIDDFADGEVSLFTLRRGEGVHLTKWPGDVETVRMRLLLDPHLFVICMLRDPRDVITSKHRADPDRYWAHLRMWRQRLRHARHIFGHPRVTLVKYEHLVTEPDLVQASIAARLPFLSTKGQFSRFHLTAAPGEQIRTALGEVRPIDCASIGNWRRHLPRLAGQIAQHGPITAELIELGYETDDSWLSALENVRPDTAPSHWPERPVRRRAWKGRLYARLRQCRNLLAVGIERSLGNPVA